MGVMDCRMTENTGARSHLMMSTVGIPARRISSDKHVQPTFTARDPLAVPVLFGTRQ